MKRKFAINLALLVILNLLIKPFWVFGIDRSVQNMVGAGEYGFYFSLFGFSVLLNIILDSGLTNFNNRSISQNPSLVKNYLSHIIVIKILLAVLYTLLLFALAFVLGYDKRQINLLIFIALNQFFASFILYFRSNISGLQLFTIDSMLSVLDRIIMIVLCSIAIWGSSFRAQFRIEWFVYLQTISYLIATLIIGGVVYAKAGSFNLKFNREYTLKILKQSIPFAVLIFLMGLYNRIDGVMLERMLPNGKVQAGIYAQSFRVLEAVSMFAYLFAGLLLPMFSRMLGSNENILPLLRLSFSILFITSIAFSFGCFTYNEQLVGLLYKHNNGDSSNVFAIMVFCFIPACISYIFGTLLTASGSLKALNYTALAALLINVLLNVILIPKYMAKGAAISSVITQSLVAIAQIWISIKKWNIRPSQKTFISYSLFILLSVLTGFIFNHSGFAWGGGFIFMTFIILGLALLTGVMSLREIIASVGLRTWGWRQ